MPGRPPILRRSAQRPGPQQVEAWCETVSPLWEVTVAPEQRDRFVSSSEVVHLGSCIIGNTAATAHKTERSPGLIARMGVDHVLAQLRLSGTSQLQANGRQVELVPGDVSLLDMSRPLATDSTDYEAITIAFPRTLWAAAVKDVDTLHGAVLTGATPLGQLAAAHLSALSRQAGRLSPEEASAAVEGTVALVAACAGSGRASQELAETAERPTGMIVLRRFIEENLASPHLSAELLAQRFGVSRSTLYRLFKPFDGVATYVRRRRLARAYRDLAAASSPYPVRVQEVAFRWNFDDPAHFVRAFRQEFGCTPGEVRAAALARLPSPGPVKPEFGGDLFAWVMELAA